jgi:hypothetical protein
MNIAVDLKNLVTCTNLTAPTAKTSTVTGTGIDVKEYIGNIMIIQDVGTVSGTTPTLDGKIQSSADNSTNWTDVTGATFTQVTASTSLQTCNVDTRLAKRYIRYVGTIAGTTPSFSMDVVAVGQKQVVGSTV